MVEAGGGEVEDAGQRVEAGHHNHHLLYQLGAAGGQQCVAHVAVADGRGAHSQNQLLHTFSHNITLSCVLLKYYIGIWRGKLEHWANFETNRLVSAPQQ